jgi:hypothetical protein
MTDGGRTADRRRTGFPACQGGQTVNEWGNESTNADRGGRPPRRTGFPACQGGADRQRMGERINECGPRTANGGIEAGLDGWFRVSRKDERQGAKTNRLGPQRSAMARCVRSFSCTASEVVRVVQRGARSIGERSGFRSSRGTTLSTLRSPVPSEFWRHSRVRRRSDSPALDG